MSRPEFFARGSDITFQIDLQEGQLADISSIAVDLRAVAPQSRRPAEGSPAIGTFSVTVRNPGAAPDRGGWIVRIPGATAAAYPLGDYVAGPLMTMSTGEKRYGKEVYITIFEPATVRP